MLLMFDGFDSLGTSGSWNLSRRYPVICASGISNFGDIAAGQINGYALQFDGSNQIFRTWKLTTVDTVVVGFALKLVSGYATAGNHILSLYDGTTEGVGIYVAASGELKIMRGGSGGTQLAITSGFGLTTGVWYWFELKVKCASGTDGTVDLRSGGVSVASNSATNTKAGSNNYHDVIGVNGVATASKLLDDLYVLDTSGSVNNDFLGPVHVTRLDPVSDNGTNQWTTQSGSNHAAMVDDSATLDDDSTYVESATATDAEIWNCADYVGDPVKGVQICTDVRDTDAKSFSIKSTSKLGSGTINKSSSAAVPGANYATIVHLMETDPDGNPWTASNLSNTAFGVEVA